MYYLLIKSLHLIFVLLHLINIIQSELVALITETNTVILGLVISCVLSVSSIKHNVVPAYCTVQHCTHESRDRNPPTILK